MPALATETIVLITLAMIAGGFVKGTIGIGLPIVCIAILSNFLNLHLVLAIVIGPILVTNLWQAVHAGNLLIPLKRFWSMILCLVLGILTTARLVVEMDTSWLYVMIGCAVIIFSVTSFIRPSRGLAPKTEHWAAPVAGALGGFLGGLSTIWGPPMMMYMLMLRLTKEEFIRAVGLVWFAGSLPLVFGYWQNGILTRETALLSTLAVLPALIGLWLGGRLRRHIDQETFRKILLLMLFLIGLNLIRRAVF